MGRRGDAFANLISQFAMSKTPQEPIANCDGFRAQSLRSQFATLNPGWSCKLEVTNCDLKMSRKCGRKLRPHQERETMANTTSATVANITSAIHTIRGQKVILDKDLARIYGVTTKRLNEQVKRNAKRFPTDFLFQLTAEELDSLRSQIATLKTGRGQHRSFSPTPSPSTARSWRPTSSTARKRCG